MDTISDALARQKMKECAERGDLTSALEWARHVTITDEEFAIQRENWVRAEMRMGETAVMMPAGAAEFPDITDIRYLWIEKQRRDRRQLAMMVWADDTFGHIDGLDTRAPAERARRFLEESIELCQAVGMARDEAAKILDYVYAREPGQPLQEFGGTSVTLAMLAEALATSLCAAELAEWDRIQTKSKAHFEARHRAKMEIGI